MSATSFTSSLTRSPFLLSSKETDGFVSFFFSHHSVDEVNNQAEKFLKICMSWYCIYLELLCVCTYRQEASEAVALCVCILDVYICVCKGVGQTDRLETQQNVTSGHFLGSRYNE